MAKIAVVTGGSRGIGRAVAIKLAADGMTVVVNYNGNKEKAETVVAEIQANGGQAEAYGCNVSDYSAVEEMMKYVIKTYGSVDVLVNNAGITRDGLMMKMSEDDFNQVVDINLKGCFNCTKHVARQMLKQKAGRIINLSSVIGIYGNVGQANYAASKAGVIGITKSMAKELGSRGITVNAVAPGFIETDMTAAMTEEAKAVVADHIAMKRGGKPEEVANLISFLASENAAYITGQVIAIDGGMSI